MQWRAAQTLKLYAATSLRVVKFEQDPSHSGDRLCHGEHASQSATRTDGEGFLLLLQSPARADPKEDPR